MLVLSDILVVYEHYMIDSIRLERLKGTFPKLTDVNQHFVLGLTTGLKYVQDKFKKPSKPVKETPAISGEAKKAQ